MNETEFWKIIDLVDQTAMERESRAAITDIVDELSNQSMAEIRSFYNHLCNALFKLDTRPHFMATEAQTDDSFEYQRCYVVGKEGSFVEELLQPLCSSVFQTHVGWIVLLHRTFKWNQSLGSIVRIEGTGQLTLVSL